MYSVVAPIAQNGVAVTTGGTLTAKYVIHLDIMEMNGKRDWKRGISRCLEEAEKAELTSVSFPALGTGRY